MDLTKLTDKELEQSFNRAVKAERKIMHIVVLHVLETMKRQYFLGKGFPSLRAYLIEEMKYSSTSAQRRIEAARLLDEVPFIADKLESGDLNLSQIGEIHRSIKEAEKVHDEKVSKSYKGKIVEQVLGKTTSQTQQACAQMLEIPIVETQKCRTQKNGSKRIEMTVTKAQDEKYERVRGILAQKHFQTKRTQSMPDILETMYDVIIEGYETIGPKPKSKTKTKIKSQIQNNSKNSEAEKCKS